MARHLSATKPGQDTPSYSWRLRAADQACCAALTAIGLGLMIATWVYHGGLSGRIIDIQRAERRAVSFQLDINHADWPEWTMLPGIGEMLARRIVDSRRAAGPFRSREDLLRVRGIGPRTLERIRPYLLPVSNSDEQ